MRKRPTCICKSDCLFAPNSIIGNIRKKKPLFVENVSIMVNNTCLHVEENIVFLRNSHILISFNLKQASVQRDLNFFISLLG